MPFDYAVPSVPDGSRIDYSDRLLGLISSIPEWQTGVTLLNSGGCARPEKRKMTP